MTVPEARQFLAFARAGRVRLEFGNPRHLEALAIGQLLEEWKQLSADVEVECSDCEGDGTVECCECGQDRECKNCTGTGRARPRPHDDLDQIKHEVELWQSVAATA